MFYQLFTEFWLICLKVILIGGHRAAAQFFYFTSTFRTDDGQNFVPAQPNANYH